MRKVLVINGPNLNLLGQRQTKIYGSLCLGQIEKNLKIIAKENNLICDTKQTNSEAEFIQFVHSAYNNDVNFLIVNAGAYTHTSIAIRDALLAVNIPFIEIHVSNIYQREQFRHHSYLSDIAVGVICGLGEISYQLALQAIIHQPV